MGFGAGVRVAHPALQGTHPIQAQRAQFREEVGEVLKRGAFVSEAERARTCSGSDSASHSHPSRALGLSFPICKMEGGSAGTGQACSIQTLLLSQI